MHHSLSPLPHGRGDSDALPPDYVVVGHCALDLQPDGSYLPGGTVLYGALTAARLGMRAAILTAGDPDALGQALAPFMRGFAIEIVPRAATTIFENVPTPQGRKQTLHGWAGPILPEDLPAAWRGASILHLGPIAAEVPPDAWAEYLTASAPPWPVTTPQGWLRHWDALPSPVRHETLQLPGALLDRLRGIVISSEERDVAEATVRHVAAHGFGAITLGTQGVDLLHTGTMAHVDSFPVTVQDETGAGDVFAAAWFVGMARGESAEAAARVACAAAALSITAPGPNGIPHADAVARLVGAT
jgi:sugar/nucleoside kinase (ribokinase family)